MWTFIPKQLQQLAACGSYFLFLQSKQGFFNIKCKLFELGSTLLFALFVWIILNRSSDIVVAIFFGVAHFCEFFLV